MYACRHGPIVLTKPMPILSKHTAMDKYLLWTLVLPCNKHNGALDGVAMVSQEATSVRSRCAEAALVIACVFLGAPHANRDKAAIKL